MWADAAIAKEAKDKWQKQADHEKSMIEKTTWAITHAEEQIIYFDKRQKFDKCKEYQTLLNKAKAYLERVPAEDMILDIETEEDTPSHIARDVEPDIADNEVACDVERDEVLVDDVTATDDEASQEEGVVDAESIDGLKGAAKSNCARKRKCRAYKYKKNITGTGKKQKSMYSETAVSYVKCAKFLANKKRDCVMRMDPSTVSAATRK